MSSVLGTISEKFQTILRQILNTEENGENAKVNTALIEHTALVKLQRRREKCCEKLNFGKCVSTSY